jgi:putative membrane protein
MRQIGRYHLGRAALAGAAGGLAGALTMNLLSYVWQKSHRSLLQRDLNQQGTRPDVEAARKDPSRSERPATARLVEQVAEPVVDRRLSSQEKEIGGRIVHYAYGIAMGAVYGAANELLPPIRRHFGALFGLALWAGGVLVVLPRLRLTRPVSTFSLPEHAFGVLGHVAYGVALESARRAVRERL